MTGPPFVQKVYFAIILPVLGGFAVAYAASELIEFGPTYALGLGGVFGYAAYRVGPQNNPGATWRSVRAAFVTGTAAIALIPVAAGIAFTVNEQADSSLPSLLTALLAAFGATVLVAVLFSGDEGNLHPDRMGRGGERGGIAELQVDLLETERKAHVEAQKKRRAARA